LDLNSVIKETSPSDGDLKTYYEQNVQRLSGAEERRASPDPPRQRRLR
jgi:peptidyl-prolyl cis-trans isomerase D